MPTTPRIAPHLPASNDPLGKALAMMRLTGVLYCHAELSAPWGIRIPALSGVMYVEVVTGGTYWLELGGQHPIMLSPGEVAVIPRGTEHCLRSSPKARTTPLARIPVELVSDRFEVMRFGGGGRRTDIAYFGIRYDPVLAAQVVGLLPPVLVIRPDAEGDPWLHATVQHMASEAERREPGHETVVTRLADIVVIQALRTWLAQARNEPTGWLTALHDPKIGRALTLLHDEPAHTWRVASLARRVGMSRSGLAARFSSLVGMSVHRYLTRVRMQIAYSELRFGTAPASRIAERVGYQSEPAFNRAFKREYGTPPGALRKTLTTGV